MRRLAALAVVLLAVAALVGARWEQWAMAALAPSGRFDAAALPPAPDYADPAAWTALPDRRDEADSAPPGLPGIDQTQAPVAVFYLHPTSHLGDAWNGPIGDARLDADTDLLSTRIQASAFNACCAVYGPRYRQAQGYAFIAPGPDASAAIEVAYADVRAAFHFFLEQHARGRPFVLAGHSQGAVLGARLLREEIAPTPLRERLVAAYLIGAPIAAATAGVPTCAAPDDTGCLVTWNARGPRFAGSVFDFPAPGERVCVNPLTWRADEVPAPASLNEGAVFLDASDGTPLPAFADARCRDGVLVVSEIGDPPRDWKSRVLDFVAGTENYHPIEYQLYYVNLRRNAQQRVQAFLGRHDPAT